MLLCIVRAPILFHILPLAVAIRVSNRIRRVYDAQFGHGSLQDVDRSPDGHHAGFVIFSRVQFDNAAFRSRVPWQVIVDDENDVVELDWLVVFQPVGAMVQRW